MQRKARGAPFGYSKQATSNAAMRPNYPPSLRVASKCGACGVALLAKGTTLGFVARLAVIRIWRQRVSCDECKQTLVQRLSGRLDQLGALIAGVLDLAAYGNGLHLRG